MFATVEFHSTDNINDKMTITQLKHMQYSMLLQRETSFSIYLNGQEYFHDDYFCIFEFLQTLVNWHEPLLQPELNYIAIDSEDNPIISFRRSEHGWSFSSPWANFDASLIWVSEEELIKAVDSLIQKYLEPYGTF